MTTTPERTEDRVELPLVEMPALARFPKADEEQTRKDFTSDAEVRWCPGCGDYAVLAAVQGFLPELGIRRESVVFVSGDRLLQPVPVLPRHLRDALDPRAGPAIATGIAVSRPDLSVWVVTGDGDGLSIGGNHMVHALRRNVDLKILLFNNRIYGLTKGQYSPTSETGKVTKSTPFGSVDEPLDPLALAVGAGATFVARALDSDRKGLTEVLRAAASHQGSALVEIYQNCNVFNDDAFLPYKDRDQRDDVTLRLQASEPMVFGADGDKGVKRTAGRRLRGLRGRRPGRRGPRPGGRRPHHRLRPVPPERPHADGRHPRSRPADLRRHRP